MRLAVGARRATAAMLAYALLFTVVGIAVVAALATKGQVSGPLAAAAIAAVAGAGLATPLLHEWIKTLVRTTFERRTAVRQHCMNGHKGRLPLVGDVGSATSLGVHPAAGIDREPSTETDLVPAYVRRDEDDRIDTLIGSGVFLLITGESASGKSRTAFEATRRQCPRRKLVAPREQGSLRTLVDLHEMSFKNTLVWLDDLERYLDDGQFDPQLLDYMLNDGAVVVATMRSTEFDRYGLTRNAEPTEPSREITRAPRHVLARAAMVSLRRRLSTTETERAKLDRSDQRVIGALEHSTEYGFAEYLVAGPHLAQELATAEQSDGHIRVGAAIVHAAIACRRAGYRKPINLEILRRLHTRFLDESEHKSTTDEVFAKGLTWATSARFGRVAPLSERRSGHYQVFDYLLEIDGHERSRPIPKKVWTILRELGSPQGQIPLTLGAITAGRLKIAESIAVAALANRGTTKSALLLLGEIAERRNNFTKAESWYRNLITEGHQVGAVCLANLARKRGDTANAKRWCKTGLTSPEVEVQTRCSTLLGLIYLDSGDTSSAEQHLLIAAKSGSAHAASLLAELYAQVDEVERSLHWRTKAAKEGSGDAAVVLGNINLKRGNFILADHWFTTARKAGADIAAAEGFAELAENRCDNEAALKHWLYAANAGSLHAQTRLAAALAKQDERDQSELWLRRAALAGHTPAMVGLALFIVEGGDPTNALAWLRNAWKNGDTDAAWFLGILMRDLRSDIPTSAKWFRRAAQRGHADAPYHLAGALLTQGKHDEAESTLRTMLTRPSKDRAMVELGRLFEARNDHHKARIWYAKAVEYGNSDAQEHLIRIQQNRPHPTVDHDRTESHAQEK